MEAEELEKAINSLAVLENAEMLTIGNSVQGRPICAFHVGCKCGKQIIVIGAIHAREWITALLVAELVKFYSRQNVVRRRTGGIYFVPLCNPDGVRIALGEGKPLWKANARGVDLNVNFDADWGRGAQNVREAGSENFIGLYPNSEPEVRGLINFTLRVKPKATVAYHSKGEVIYYGFEDSNCVITPRQILRTARLARKIGTVTGYQPQKTKDSAGGYSDWAALHLNIPAVTIEVGDDSLAHPISEDLLPEIFEQNKNVPEEVLRFVQ